MIKKLISAGFWYGSLSVVVYHLACVQMDFANLQLPLCTQKEEVCVCMCVCIYGWVGGWERERGGSVLCEQEGHWRRREQSRGENKNNQDMSNKAFVLGRGFLRIETERAANLNNKRASGLRHENKLDWKNRQISNLFSISNRKRARERNEGGGGFLLKIINCWMNEI